MTEPHDEDPVEPAIEHVQAIDEPSDRAQASAIFAVHVMRASPNRAGDVLTLLQAVRSIVGSKIDVVVASRFGFGDPLVALGLRAHSLDDLSPIMGVLRRDSIADIARNQQLLTPRQQARLDDTLRTLGDLTVDEVGAVGGIVMPPTGDSSWRSTAFASVSVATPEPGDWDTTLAAAEQAARDLREASGNTAVVMRTTASGRPRLALVAGGASLSQLGSYEDALDRLERSSATDTSFWHVHEPSSSTRRWRRRGSAGG